VDDEFSKLQDEDLKQEQFADMKTQGGAKIQKSGSPHSKDQDDQLSEAEFEAKNLE
jgi:hypothetical protein